MRKRFMFSMPVFALAAVGAGCTSPAEQGTKPRVTTESPKPAPAAKPKPATFTAANNPTALAGRGEPSLEDRERPAAWVYIDGKAGKFNERDGQRLTQWTVEGTVGSTPTFRVEGYEPLLGTPQDFKCVLQAIESPDGSDVVYGITANEGTFSPAETIRCSIPATTSSSATALAGTSFERSPRSRPVPTPWSAVSRINRPANGPSPSPTSPSAKASRSGHRPDISERRSDHRLDISERDLPPVHVPAAVRVDRASPCRAGGGEPWRSAAQPARHAAANSAGVWYPRLLCGRRWLYSKR